jgi:hypothetical protein
MSRLGAVQTCHCCDSGAICAIKRFFNDFRDVSICKLLKTKGYNQISRYHDERFDVVFEIFGARNIFFRGVPDTA